MTKILILLPLFNNTGPSNVVSALLPHLKKQGFDITLATFLGIDSKYKSLLEQNQCKLLLLNGFSLTNIFRLISHIKNNKIEIVHGHGLLPDIATAFINIFSPTKTVSTVHCNLDDNYKNEYTGIKSFIYKFIHKAALALVKNRVAVSSAAQHSIPYRANIIHNGVDLDKNTTTTKIVESDALSLVYIGRLISGKNLVFLVNAVNQINKIQSQKVELHIVGDGPQIYELKNIATANVHFHGFLTSPWQNLPSNTIFINPSLSEGMPMAVLEALALNFPVLLSNIAAHQEIESKMETGVYLFHYSTESLLSAINKCLLECKTDNFESSLMTSYSENFSAAAMANSYLTLYKKMLSL